VRALLAAAPKSGEARRNFARSLLRGVDEAEDGSDSVFGLARTLLEVREPGPAAGRSRRASRPSWHVWWLAGACTAPYARLFVLSCLLQRALAAEITDPAGSGSPATDSPAAPAARAAGAAAATASNSSGSKYDALLSALSATAASPELEVRCCRLSSQRA
jgi:hypothetical protein